MKTNFRLVEPNSDKSTRIYLSIWKDNLRAKFYPGLTLPHPKLWDSRRQRASLSKSYTFAKIQKNKPELYRELENINNELDDIQSLIPEYKEECRKKELRITSKGLKEYLKEEFINSKKTVHTPFLADYMEKVYLPGIESGVITYRKGNEQLFYSKGTIKAFKSSMKAFQHYESSKNKRHRFDDIDLKFHEDFVEWHFRKGLKANYIGRLIKDLKKILEYTYNTGLHNNTIHRHSDFFILREEVDNIYLTEDELDLLYQAKLPANLSHYRDVFLVGCYTALRFGDFSRLKADHIDNDFKFINIIATKGNNKLKIPIRPELKNILSKKGYLDHPQVNLTVMNRKLKEIGKLAGIDSIYEEQQTINRKKVIRTVHKYEKIKTHTARRTAATNMYLAGMPILDIMAITGHKTEKSFRKYIKAEQFERANELVNHRYFTKKLKKAI